MTMFKTLSRSHKSSYLTKDNSQAESYENTKYEREKIMCKRSVLDRTEYLDLEYQGLDSMVDW